MLRKGERSGVPHEMDTFRGGIDHPIFRDAPGCIHRRLLAEVMRQTRVGHFDHKKCIGRFGAVLEVVPWLHERDVGLRHAPPARSRKMPRQSVDLRFQLVDRREIHLATFFGFRATTSFEAGLRRTIDWYREDRRSI